MASTPLIVGLSGSSLTADEASFLKEARPLGLILFARNIDNADGVRRLVADATEAAGTDLVLIDQEGGRVQRLKPPFAPRYPAARTIGDLYGADPAAGLRAAHLSGALIAADCLGFGINVPCLPVADVPVPGAHDVIGDRAYAETPAAASALAAAVAEGVMASGAIPVMKHIPGHGRAVADSHRELPTVTATVAELEQDFAPFKALAALPIAMTAHVRYSAIDEAAPATLSPAVVSLIRGTIGFGGLLITDDVSMRALPGPVEKDGPASLAAGCDVVLHCNGRLPEMTALAAALPAMSEAVDQRAAVARTVLGNTSTDAPALREEFEALMFTQRAA